MILRKLVRESVVKYFTSQEWLGFVETLSRGREVRHAHCYTDSILDPKSVERVAERYFLNRGLPLERKVGLLSHGKGYGNVYYIQPQGMCHFEIFTRFNSDVVLEPMPASATRGGESAEYWDDAFMQRYYERFQFAELDATKRTAVERYFDSDAWKAIYGVMIYGNERNVHSHAIVETNIHPEDILPIGVEALERRGWTLDRGVSVVFNVGGLEQGKITYLLKEPETVMELEWEFNPDIDIRPAVEPVARIINKDMVASDLAGVPYIVLGDDDVEWIGSRI